MQDEGGPVYESLPPDETPTERPRLTLVHPDDDEDEPVSLQAPEMLASEDGLLTAEPAGRPDPVDEDSAFGSLWMHAAGSHAEHEAAVDLAEFDEEAEDGCPSAESDEACDIHVSPMIEFEAEALVAPRTESPATPGHARGAEAGTHLSLSEDHSAVDDIVLSNPLAEISLVPAGEAAVPVAEAPAIPAEAAHETTAPVPSRPAIDAPAAAHRPAPHRIGQGRLVPVRLTWKPGDPFAAGAKPVGGRFRWELMLTAACITAVCGLGCIWVLRTVLA
jgi:hypothetical protein